MASDGLSKQAKTGKCRICHRIRRTDTHLRAVGEIRHGYATGHIWECRDEDDCDMVAHKRMNDETRSDRRFIEIALQQGRFKQYGIYS